MCGICGKINFDRTALDTELLKSMTNTLFHRGPDEEGYYVDGSVGLGVRRLSIIDLDTGSQPIPNEDKTLWVIENGEIYNFLQLKSECLLRGHSFRTKTDTEVNLHLYEDYGMEFVKFIKGMFAIAIYDKPNKKLILVRDRVGIKPLYYYADDKTLIFASEMKAILVDPLVKKKLNIQAVYNYFGLNYIPGPLTIYENIFKLPAGHMLICNIENATISIKSYWDLPMPVEEGHYDEKGLINKLENILRQAIKRQLISDVPLGVFLSGGIDSSTVVAMMNLTGQRPINTFSIGFKEKNFNELPFARIVSRKFKTQHQEFIVRPELKDVLPRLALHFDEPFGDSSAVPTYYVSKLAREAGLKVVLSGDGGDEVFGGYNTYQIDKVLNLCNSIPKYLRIGICYTIANLAHIFKKQRLGYITDKLIRDTNSDIVDIHYTLRKIFNCDIAQELKKKFTNINAENNLELFKQITYSKKSQDLINSILYLDLKVSLVDDMLTKIDRMSMLNSIETRVPLLDEEVIEFMAMLSSIWKVRLTSGKYLFRQTMAPILPRQILRRKKMGFSIPEAKWLREDLKDMVFDNLLGGGIKDSGLFDLNGIKKMLDSHIKEEYDYKNQIWGLLIFSLWHEQRRI